MNNADYELRNVKKHVWEYLVRNEKPDKNKLQRCVVCKAVRRHHNKNWPCLKATEINLIGGAGDGPPPLQSNT